MSYYRARMFENLLGNEPIKAYLKRAAQQNRLGSTLLFSGIDGIGKSLFAKHLASELLKTSLPRVESGNYPDFHSLFPEGKSGLHTIESLRELIHEVHEAPFESSGKMFVIHSAEKMQPAAMNALLKTLEEPTPDTTIVLITSSPNEMLPTILSRCIRLSFQPLAEEHVAELLRQRGLDGGLAKKAMGSIGRAIELIEYQHIEETLFQAMGEKTPAHAKISALEKLDEFVDDDDPAKKNRKADYVITSLSMWWRDQHAMKLGVDPKHLFFPGQSRETFRLPALEKVEQVLQEARLAWSRNMKISQCLFPILWVYLILL